MVAAQTGDPFPAGGDELGSLLKYVPIRAVNPILESVALPGFILFGLGLLLTETLFSFFRTNKNKEERDGSGRPVPRRNT